MPAATVAAAPRLETPRLVLRATTIADVENSAALWQDPAVVRFIGGRPSTGEEVWARLLRYAGLWSLLGYGYWAVEERATGRYAGEVGFGDFARDLTPSIAGTPEAGWVLAPWCHGRGYASEAVAAAHAWIAPRHARTVCIISPDNTPSLRVAEKAGYRAYAETTYKENAIRVLEREARAGL